VARPALAGVAGGAVAGVGLALPLDHRQWWVLALAGVALMLLVCIAAQFAATREAHKLVAMTRVDRPIGPRPTPRRKALR
jgi:hypothetical protein